MSENYSIILTKVPKERKISVLKATRSITSKSLKEAKELVESLPQLVTEVTTELEAERIKVELERSGAIVTISQLVSEVESEINTMQLEKSVDIATVHYSFESLNIRDYLANGELDLIDSMQKINDRIVILRQELSSAEKSESEAASILFKVKEKFKNIKLELEQLGLVLYSQEKGNYIEINQTTKDIFTKIDTIKVKISEASEAQNKREEDSKTGFWGKLKSSVGNFFDSLEKYQQELSDYYIELAQVIVCMPEEDTNISTFVSSELIENVKNLSVAQSNANLRKTEALDAKKKIMATIEQLLDISRKNLQFCSNYKLLELGIVNCDTKLAGEIKNAAIKAEAIKKTEEAKKAAKEAAGKAAKKFEELKHTNFTAKKTSNNEMINYPHAKNNLGGQISLVDDYIIITRGGFFKFQNFFDDDANVVKIPVENITVINYKKSGIKDGFMEIIYPGYFPRPGQPKHGQENVITFRGKKHNNDFEAFKEIVEKRMREIKSGSNSPKDNSSPADELVKYSRLHKDGILTDEEFAAKKAQILGI